MPKGRLTQKELSWLLAQEAKGAAERLRLDVQTLRLSVAPPPLEETRPDLDSTLDALDDAMRMLGALHQRPPRGRRGRVDLAALLWELSPDVRVTLAPGTGTEVYGDEEELRRMLQVMLGATHSGAEVAVRGEDGLVAVGVPLGSEGGIGAESERAWLSRMAIRYGGRYAVHGDEAVLALPADASRERTERAALQRELDAARKQGERTLALPALSDATRHIAAELRGLLAPLARELEDSGPSSEPMRGRLGRVQQFVSELASLGELEADEDPRELDLGAALAELTCTPPIGGVSICAPPRLTHELLKVLFSHPLTSPPRYELTMHEGSFSLKAVTEQPLSPWRRLTLEQLTAALEWSVETENDGARITLRGPLAPAS